jgi:hypothetical protein
MLIMQRFNAWNFLWASAMSSTAAMPQNRNAISPQEYKDNVRRIFGAIAKDCQDLGLLMSLAAAKRIVALCDQEGTTDGEIADQCDEQFFKRLVDELSQHVVYAVPPSHAYLVRTPNLYGDDVAQAFPKTIADIEEAGKCLAFDRATACVMHLMRVMEAGLNRLGVQLGHPYAPSWEGYLKEIQRRIDEKHQHKTVDWLKDEPYFRNCLGDLTAVKIAWRNPSMHIVRRYTPEEAKQIFDAVGILMRRIAERDQAVNGASSVSSPPSPSAP